MKQLLIFLITVCFYTSVFAQNERLVVPWPETWKIGSEQKNKTMKMVELVPNNESVDKWTIIGTTQTYTTLKGLGNSPIENIMNVTFDQAKKNAIDPKLTFIEKKEDGKNPWILFKIESASFKNDKNPESELYYVVAGDEALYSNFVAIKSASLTGEFTGHWTAIFKSSQLVKLSP
jgi:hypothetical protein